MREVTPYNILDIELFCSDSEHGLYCSRIKLKSNDTGFTFQYKTLAYNDPLSNALGALREELSNLSTWCSTYITHYNNSTFQNGSINKNILNKLIKREAL